MEDIPNPSLGILTFAVFTIIYSLSRYYYTSYETRGDENSKMIMNDNIILVAYVLLIGISQYISNLTISTYLCGNPQYGVVFYSSIIPFICIFGILIVLLSVNESWYAPFENTFGYGILLFTGLTSFFKKILINNNNDSSEADKTISNIMNDKSMIINEISSKNSDIFFDKMKDIINKEIHIESCKVELWQYARIKEITSQTVWFMLTGLLMTTISYNFIINKGCKLTVKQLNYKEREEAKNNREVNPLNENRDLREGEFQIYR